MAYHLQLRHDTAATWTSVNPVLAQGEPGVETDTGKLKIGDGSSAWSALTYQGTAGTLQTSSYKSLGDGSDGNITISSGITTLTRDMYYNNLTINGTGTIFTANYRIFVKGVLDLTAAPTGAINNNGQNGGNASGLTGGTAAAVLASGTLSAKSPGTNGATGTTGAGVAASIPAVFTGSGGAGASGGAGGLGLAGNGVAGATSRTPSLQQSLRRYATNFLVGSTFNGGGIGGAGGTSGTGDNFFVAEGGGGGAGGNGGGVLAVYANIVVKSSSTAAGTLQATGGNGGNGGAGLATLGGTGGGGGGGGAGGGWIYFAYNRAYGPTVSSFFDVSAGAGGNGGNAYALGTASIGGSGGNAGSGGRVFVIQIPTGVSTELDPLSPAGIILENIGSSPKAAPGGSGGINDGAGSTSAKLNF